MERVILAKQYQDCMGKLPYLLGAERCVGAYHSFRATGLSQLGEILAVLEGEEHAAALCESPDSGSAP
jgi:hypothetical protein